MSNWKCNTCGATDSRVCNGDNECCIECGCSEGLEEVDSQFDISMMFAITMDHRGQERRKALPVAFKEFFEAHNEWEEKAPELCSERYNPWRTYNPEPGSEDNPFVASNGVQIWYRDLGGQVIEVRPYTDEELTLKKKVGYEKSIFRDKPKAEKLRNCPFCGSHAYKRREHIIYAGNPAGHTTYICCKGCGATAPTVDIWNRRDF